MENQILSLLNRELLPSKKDFLLWMEGKPQIILETAKQVMKDFERSGFDTAGWKESLNKPQQIREILKTALNGRDLKDPRMMQLYYLVDIPEEVLSSIAQNEQDATDQIIELILYRCFTKVYFRSVYK